VVANEVRDAHALGSLLRERRLEAGLTQEQLAEHSGVGLRTIRDLERGRVRRPHRDTITLVASALGLSAAARDELAQAGCPRPATGPGQASAAPPTPRQLPPAVPHFTGRARALKTLTDLLSETAPPGRAVVISAIDGTAGIGKTALAVHWAHQVAEHFPDGQLYVNLRGFDPGGQPMAPAEAIHGFLDALGVPAAQLPMGLQAQVTRYRSLLAGRRMLVLLDNARDAAQVRPLLPGSPGCLVLVTSRSQLLSLVAGEGAQPITLDLLTAAEAQELLVRRLGADRVGRESRAAEELVALCARLPLALNIVAARAASEPARPLSEMAGQLRETRRRRLDLLDAGDPVTDVRAVFSWSCQRLSGPAARMFRLLGAAHPGPDISAAAAASLAGLSLEQARQALGELTAARLLAQQPAGRFSFHDLLRAYAAEQAESADSDRERGAATRRVVGHYVHTAYRANRLISPTREPITLAAPPPGITLEELAADMHALAWLEAEHHVLLAAVAAAAGSGLDSYAWQLAWALSDFLTRRGHWQANVTTQEVALAATRHLGDLEAQARVHVELGWAHGTLGRYQDSGHHLEQALNLYQHLGHRRGQAIVNLSLAHLHVWQDRHGESRDYARRALEISQAEGDRTAQANALNTIGWNSANLGEYQQARASCQQALGLLRDLGDRLGEAATLDSLGYVYRHLGDYQHALDHYEQALWLFTDLGDRYKQAEALTGLGDTHHAAGCAAPARERWQQALDILTDLGHPDAGAVRDKLGQHTT
jgi:tetratricopeptide (TPR) repeat protein/transcriptional regulator with XRE-family HTH domain